MIPETLFVVLRADGCVSDSGRYSVPVSRYVKINQLYGVLASIKQAVTSRHGQVEHTLMHEIVSHGPPSAARGDVLLSISPNSKERQFYVLHIDNPGELGHFTIYYCEERAAVQWADSSIPNIIQSNPFTRSRED